jgi:Mrp family chromosome partitioning ATPase
MSLQFSSATADPAVMARHHILPGCGAAGVSAYRILRTRVLRGLQTNNWSTLGITGTTSGEGKTLVAINLAIALAEEPGLQVFLLDLDLHRPRVALSLGMSCPHGLTDYLTGSAGLENVVYDIGIARLALVPNRNASNATELLRTPRMNQLIETLRSVSPRTIILFDMPPLLSSDIALSSTRWIESLLVVVAQGCTDRHALRNMNEALTEFQVLGVVLNRSTELNDSRYY